MGRPWTEDEIALLRDVTLTLQEVAERTGRPLHGVENKANRLGIKRYGSAVPAVYRLTTEQEALLRDTSLSYADIAAVTGWPVRSVEHKAKMLGVRRLPDFQDWSPEELAVLGDRSRHFPELAAELGRSRDAVKIKAGRLGAHKRRYWHQPGHVPDSNDYRGPGWARLRAQVLERDAYVCQETACALFAPSGSGLVVHHVIPWRLRPVNDLRWLTTLCRSCHGKRSEHAWAEIPEHVAALLA